MATAFEFEVPSEGKAEAVRLAVHCFMEDMTQTKFSELTIEKKVEFAKGVAGLDPSSLEKALSWFGAYYQAHAEALRKYAESNRRGHERH